MKIPTGKWTSVLGLILCLSMACKKHPPSSPFREKTTEYTIRVKGVFEHSDTYVNIQAIGAGTFCIVFSFLGIIILKSSHSEHKQRIVPGFAS
jgi:hypothetical protein